MERECRARERKQQTQAGPVTFPEGLQWSYQARRKRPRDAKQQYVLGQRMKIEKWIVTGVNERGGPQSNQSDFGLR